MNTTHVPRSSLYSSIGGFNLWVATGNAIDTVVRVVQGGQGCMYWDRESWQMELFLPLHAKL